MSGEINKAGGVNAQKTTNINTLLNTRSDLKGNSLKEKITELMNNLSSGKLNNTQKTEATEKLNELKQQQETQEQEKSNPLKGKSIFDVAKNKTGGAEKSD